MMVIDKHQWYKFIIQCQRFFWVVIVSVSEKSSFDEIIKEIFHVSNIIVLQYWLYSLIVTELSETL